MGDDMLIDGTMMGAATSLAPAGVFARERISVVASHSLHEVEAVWRALSAQVESPGQDYDFIRVWVQDRGLSPREQRYVVGRVDGQPVALLPLHRKRVYGLPVLTWFPGANVGCYAPVANYDRLAALGSEGRKALWDAMTGAVSGGDVIYLRSIPETVDGHPGLFDELGSTLSVEHVYRARFGSWEECDRVQRSKSRRKHDRQQGDRLAALGAVEFAEVRNGAEARGIIETMFRQRSARFKAMGIRDIFVCDGLIGFYHRLAEAGSGVDVRLHVLRLDGKIVAVRYNVVHGDAMFCLISSMSDDPAIQQGSPGKQCLLKVMQSVFDGGMGVFDMGAGYTDEKRHWCNEVVPLRQHYVALNAKGALIIAAHRRFQKARAAIKGNERLKSATRSLRSSYDRLLGAKPAASGDGSDQL